MPVVSHTLPNGQVVKLGRKIPAIKPRVVQLAKYLDRPRLLRGLPESVDYFTKASSSINRDYLNRTYGICVIAGKLHQLGVFSSNDLGPDKTILATDQEALSQYRSICGPGDNGCYIKEVLDVWRTKGLTAGGKAYKIDAYCGIDAADLISLRTAIHLFGGVTFGIDLPSAWLNTNDGDLWDVTRSNSVGGHDVPAVGYTKEGVVIATWGGLRTITWAALESRRYIDECYTQLSPNWYNDDRLAPSGVAVDALKKALDDFANGILPDDPDPVPPAPIPPEPVPVPPAPSSPFTVTLPNFSFEATETDTDTELLKGQQWAGKLKADGPVVIVVPMTGGPRGKINWEALLALLLQLLPLILGDKAAREALTAFIAGYAPTETPIYQGRRKEFM